LWRAFQKVWPGLERADVSHDWDDAEPDGCSPGIVDYVYTD